MERNMLRHLQRYAKLSPYRKLASRVLLRIILIQECYKSTRSFFFFFAL